MVRTITLTGAEIKVSLGDRLAHVWIENQSSSTIYASRTSGIVAKANGVLSVKAGESKLFVDLNSDNVYLLGSGDVELQPTAFANANFKRSSGGGGATNISTTKALSILTSAWVSNSSYSGYNYRATIADATITTAKDVDVAFDMTSIGVAQTAVVGGATVMYNGGFYLYAKAVTTATLTGTYTIKAVV